MEKEVTIEITVYKGDNPLMSDVFERAHASSFIEAEAELARIGRHWEKELLDEAHHGPDDEDEMEGDRQPSDNEAESGNENYPLK